jgi:hypothetical protein
MDKKEITSAIGAHGLWKMRLRQAIDTGVSAYEAHLVNLPTICDFGKWFYSLAPPNRLTPTAKKIEQLHESFHHEAALILRYATSGNKKLAEKYFEPNEKFQRVSQELVTTLMHWVKDI